MLPVYIRYNRYGGRHFQKRAVAFIRFGHDKIPLSKQRIDPDTFEFAADDHCGIHPAFVQHGSYQGSGRCFAVGAGNRYAVL